MELPPGFRFHPTDEELIIHYLSKKVVNSSFAAIAIAQIEVNKCEPWDLAKRSKIGGSKECYFFCELGPKYSTGIRTNRATDAGYWKSTGKDKEIRRENIILGMKKTLVFYRGRAPKGEKTQWIMYEYRLEGSYEKNKWVICRVFEKSLPGQEKRAFGQAKIGPLSSMFEEEMAQGVPQPPLMDAQVASFPNSLIYEGVAFNFSAGGASASSSFYGGNVIGDKFMTSAVSNPQETGTALNTDVSSGNDVARNSFEDLWNC